MRTALGTLSDGPIPADVVIDELADAVEPALVSSTGPRYFGFVVGGALEAATAADVLTSGWDQLAFNAVSSPAAAVVEDIVGIWLKELLCLPAGESFGFVTGCAGGQYCLAGSGPSSRDG
jgi:glutamate/tyrosine decarboxylase-like PLP-dependent enzyme